MKELKFLNNFTKFFLVCSINIPFFINQLVYANEISNKLNLIKEYQIKNKPNYEDYILGSGDLLRINHEDIPSLSGEYLIAPDGSLILPRVKQVFVDGLTITELTELLNDKYEEFLLDPDISITISGFRSLKVYVGGEIARPGFYLITGQFSTVFNALQAAGGVTPFTDLDAISVIRKVPITDGGGKKKAKVSLLNLIIEGDDEQNIRIFDGDVLMVGKSEEILRKQILRASQSNLSPESVSIFVSGRINSQGRITVPQGSSLNDAVSVAGGTRVLKGSIEFIRFKRSGDIDKRIFNYSPNAKGGTFKNPILQNGDIMRVRNSILTSSFEVLTEVTQPVVGIYSIYKIFGGK